MNKNQYNGVTMKLLRRIIILFLGGTVLAIGVAMIALPGPAFIVIPAGLAILAVEFVWARRLLDSARELLPQRRTNGSPTPDDGSLFRRVFRR